MCVLVSSTVFCLLGTCVTLSLQNTKNTFRYACSGRLFLHELYIRFRFTIFFFVCLFLYLCRVLIFGLYNQITTIVLSIHASFFPIFFLFSSRCLCLPFHSIPFHLICFIPIYLHSSRILLCFESETPSSLRLPIRLYFFLFVCFVRSISIRTE